MHKFVRSLITEWRKLELPFSGETIIVAVSGGADSMSLLFAIHDLTKRRKLTHRVIVAHLNHHLRGTESDADEQFVRDYAERLGLEFIAGSAQLPARGNLEQAARDARYQFLSEIARQKGAFAVLVAHTQNDQAETFLLNLIRGSGPDGLAAMRKIRELDEGVSLVRPLLSWAGRSDTETFCRENGVPYRNDEMNSDEKYSRVRIRKTIIPLLAELNPQIVPTLARAADLVGSEARATVSSGASGNRLEVRALKSLNTPELYASLRSWLRAERGSLRSLQLKHIEAIERLILSRKSGSIVELPGGGRVVKHGGALCFTNIKVEK